MSKKKIGNSHVFFTLAAKKGNFFWEFRQKWVKKLGIPMSSLPLPAEKDNFWGEFPQQKMNKNFGNPMSSLGGVPLISGIAL